MRRTQVARTVVAGVAIVMAIAGLATGTSHAAAGSPASIAVDCGVANGVTAAVLTGEVGDTITVVNTSGTEGCTFTGYSGVVTASSLTSGVLAAGGSSTLTIVAAGSFTITPLSTGGGGTSATMTVVIGVPSNAPEYAITFDPNGGQCSSNPLTITAASGDWYALPTDGTGPYQCSREDYLLTGWSHGSTLLVPGSEELAPDLPVPAPPITPFVPLPGSSTSDTPAEAAIPTPSAPAGTPSSSAQIADHETLYAVWTPAGVGITYDANVAAADSCVDANGSDMALADRSTEREVYYAGTDDTLATSAPCSPIDLEGGPLPLLGWALAGDGPVAYPPGVDLTMTKFKAGTFETLYAVWGAPVQGGPLFIVDDNFQFRYEVDSTNLRLIVAMQIRETPQQWVGLGFHNFMFPADSLVVSFDSPEGGLQYFDGYNPGIPTLSFFPAPAPDDAPIFISQPHNPNDNVENWTAEDVSEAGTGWRTVQLSRPLETNDIFDIQFAVNGIYPVCAVYNLEQGYNTWSWNAQQPSHTKVLCGEIALY